jgi:hypothetical protein
MDLLIGEFVSVGNWADELVGFIFQPRDSNDMTYRSPNVPVRTHHSTGRGGLKIRGALEHTRITNLPNFKWSAI